MRIILNGSNWSIWYYPFTQVQSAEHIAINQFQMQSFCGQFLLRWSKNEENVHETLTNTKIPFKNVLSLTRNVPSCHTVGSKQAKRCDPPWIKQGWIPRKTISSGKLSFVHKKESEHFLELSLSICVFYRRIFNLEMPKFSLENYHVMNARQPFCWRITSAKVSNPFLPTPYMVDHLPLWGRGYVWVSLVRIFSLTYNGVVTYCLHEVYFVSSYIKYFERPISTWSYKNRVSKHFANFFSTSVV